MKYEDVIDALETKDDLIIDFKEYQITGLDTKRLILDIQGFSVIGYLKENEFVDEELIKRYYGDDVDFKLYCYYPYVRLIIKNPTDYSNNKVYVIHLNKASFTAGLQELELYQRRANGLGIGGINPWI